MTRTFILSLLTIVFLALISCGTTKSISSSTSRNQDGSSKENAIIVKSINAEYEWIKKNYPGSKVTSQALIYSSKKRYDLLTFTISTGETKEAYFDITNFFGKF
jgi:hypothetical protein